MSSRTHAPLVLTLGLFVVLVVLLVVGGMLLRKMVGDSFRSARSLREARIVAADVIKEQLDEETGIRGYATARQRILLGPYYEGRAALPRSFAKLKTVVEGNLHEARPALNDAIKVNRRWIQTIAAPVLAHKRTNRHLQLHGKALMDRFRADVGTIDGWLARRELMADERAQNATGFVAVFSAAAVTAVVLAAILFAIQQYRLGERLERQRADSEQARRKSAEARAAYEVERRIADTLQEAFLQRVFPALSAVSFSATYVPATEEAKVGGDWYDVLQLPDDRIFLAIGDVTGHGVDAVLAMSKARQLLISFALLDATPARVLEHANRELLRGRSPIITAVSAIIDIRSGEFAFAAAGHPPPVIVEPGRGARLLEFGSLPLGVAPATEYRTDRVQTAPGAMIVLYTDGLIEHSRDLAQGEAALLEAAEVAAHSPSSESAAAIRDAIFRKRSVADDVAILTVHLSEANPNALRRIA
jgi:serine phosphatase RsbU (regulator of sigma subunit)/CHASE3 domain sensor protein